MDWQQIEEKLDANQTSNKRELGRTDCGRRKRLENVLLIQEATNCQ